MTSSNLRPFNMDVVFFRFSRAPDWALAVGLVGATRPGIHPAVWKWNLWANRPNESTKVFLLVLFLRFCHLCHLCRLHLPIPFAEMLGPWTTRISSNNSEQSQLNPGDLYTCISNSRCFRIFVIWSWIAVPIILLRFMLIGIYFIIICIYICSVCASPHTSPLMRRGAEALSVHVILRRASAKRHAKFSWRKGPTYEPQGNASWRNIF